MRHPDNMRSVSLTLEQKQNSWGSSNKHADWFFLSPIISYPYLQWAHKLLQGWVNCHCYAWGAVSDVILSLGFIRGSCGYLQLASCLTLQVNKHQYESRVGTHRSVTHFHTAQAFFFFFCRFFHKHTLQVCNHHNSSSHVMTCIDVLRWSNCLGRAGPS